MYSKLPSTGLLLVLRGVQMFAGLLILALGGATVGAKSTSYYGYYGYYYSGYHFYTQPDQYAIFVGVWTMLAVGYILLSTLRVPRIAHPIAILVVEAVTNVFLFACWVALAATWAPYNCGRVTSCKTGKANAAISAVTWGLFVCTTAWVAISSVPYFKNGGHKTREPALPGGLFPTVVSTARPVGAEPGVGGAPVTAANTNVTQPGDLEAQQKEIALEHLDPASTHATQETKYEGGVRP